MEKNNVKATEISMDVKKQIAELVLGEPVTVGLEKEDMFNDAFDKMLEDFTDDEINYVLNIVSGGNPEDEMFLIIIRRMRHPLRTKGLREFISSDNKITRRKQYDRS